ncbi:hypothetical protein DXG03_008766 [Asterophora parasitica]|uniref:Histone-lysine N-methyltransferase, H3 lysine-36 specific n=1 Tax=Asterophora parasitica TaxID=117018 RepID=A0A9P7KDX6_9AGAR|nr:hypothetical protein DXG03_008766 [Asterophora parasitica]
MADQVKVEDALKREKRLSPSLLHDTDVKEDLKLEHEPWPSQSQSPTLNDELTPTKLKRSPTPTPPPSTTNGTESMSSTPPPIPTPTTGSKKSQASAVQLIGDLPIAREDALATFNEIEQNNYQFKSLGRSREALESMTCDCTFNPRQDDPDDACGANSDCINRLTQVECLPDDCRCGPYCQNQRFQNRQYSDIEIVQTEMKGFGLRAECDLPKDSFIYEYVGDVVNPNSFKKRMRDYALEGIQHFYFMMLQKDEFIDATKSGGIGRFANHSCRPNCYVAKWTVGHHVRMGIFAKRNIKRHEELTFNYNVDRYGHQAQTCYCGEDNCVGFIGGKTQTDVVTMDDLYLDALGITDEADLMELKGSKKKKGKKIDDPDFMVGSSVHYVDSEIVKPGQPTMHAIVEKEVPKVVQAIRQTQSRKVLYKLLTRVKMTEDQAALRQIMRLRGYSLMTNILDDHSTDTELIPLALECMTTWPLMNRNKVEDSRVIVSVKAIADLEDSPCKDLAQTLVDHWQSLPLYNRIPKRVKKDGEGSDGGASPRYNSDDDDDGDRPSKRSKPDYPFSASNMPMELVTAGKAWIQPRYLSGNRGVWDMGSKPRPKPPPLPTMPMQRKSELRLGKSEFSRDSIRAVIEAAAEAEAARAAEEAAAAAAAEAALLAKAEAKAAAIANGTYRKKSKPPKKTHTDEEKNANKEKRLLKLVGAVVVKCMSKHSKALDHDMFKKHAKELTQIIADKEKKSSSYKEGRLDKLSDEKVVKIKKFAKEYIAKILRKLEKSAGKRERPISSSTSIQGTSSTFQDTPNSAAGRDVVMADLDAGSGTDDEEDADEDDVDRGEGSASRSPREESSPVEQGHGMDMDVDAAKQANIQPPSDPRRRPPVDPQDSVLEPQRLNGVSPSTR